MPKQRKYLAGFDVHKGLELSGYVLENVKTGHITVVRYREYQYPTVMKWKKISANADPNRLLDLFISHLGGNKTIYTAYNNPYSCDFGAVTLKNSDNNYAYLEAVGQCDRI
uniref:Uncharacterized protein n=1 Tax=Pithovirus LCPAC404 TaxID=2506597 RepID=A0A481ZC76_9VIRU|nr:MAG: uncharacterized protein LCPAC404_01920 [Pithovirus LCPAC404]